MTIFTKESLEELQRKVNLLEVVSDYVPVTVWRGLCQCSCPLHKGIGQLFSFDKHENFYRCSGCGAQGDAISFLMLCIPTSFSEACQLLADRFDVQLVQVKRKNREKDG